ncbi:hypothetical protein D3C81_2160340 [compost metagenome]
MRIVVPDWNLYPAPSCSTRITPLPKVPLSGLTYTMPYSFSMASSVAFPNWRVSGICSRTAGFTLIASVFFHLL